jgi:2-amino-4-hydroxy-6-hydroxymethyldihydropteridine diphosphokinase
MEPPRGAIVVYLGLGANLGDRAAALRGALAGLASAGVQPLSVSRLYESDYLGPGMPQPRYLNAALAAATHLTPLALLDVTQSIERAHGRSPDTHLMPRRLDIDLLLYGDWIVRHPRLSIPHPRLEERRFVLQPLADLGALEGRPRLKSALARVAAAQALDRVADLEFDLAAAGVPGATTAA